MLTSLAEGWFRDGKCLPFRTQRLLPTPNLYKEVAVTSSDTGGGLRMILGSDYLFPGRFPQEGNSLDTTRAGSAGSSGVD